MYEFCPGRHVLQYQVNSILWQDYDTKIESEQLMGLSIYIHPKLIPSGTKTFQHTFPLKLMVCERIRVFVGQYHGGNPYFTLVWAVASSSWVWPETSPLEEVVILNLLVITWANKVIIFMTKTRARQPIQPCTKTKIFVREFIILDWGYIIIWCKVFILNWKQMPLKKCVKIIFGLKLVYRPDIDFRRDIDRGFIGICENHTGKKDIDFRLVAT